MLDSNLLKVTTRKTKEGYYQPVLIVEQTKQRYTPKDWSEPSLDRKAALNHGEWWKNESLLRGYILEIG